MYIFDKGLVIKKLVMATVTLFTFVCSAGSKDVVRTYVPRVDRARPEYVAKITDESSDA